MWSVLLPGLDLNSMKSQPGFVSLVRLWNHTAIMNPEQCDDVVVLNENTNFVLIANPFQETGEPEETEGDVDPEAKALQKAGKGSKKAGTKAGKDAKSSGPDEAQNPDEGKDMVPPIIPDPQDPAIADAAAAVH